jgi:hypothetical protein
LLDIELREIVKRLRASACREVKDLVLTSEKGIYMGDNFASEFLVGFVTGLITAGVVGFVVRKMLWCWGRVAAIRKPQTIKTDKTPWQVLVDGCKNFFLLIMLTIIFLACLVGVFLSVAASG